MLANSISEIFERIRKSDKKMKLMIICAFIGIALIMLSEAMPFQSAKNNNADKDYSYDEYVSMLERKTENLIESINGAGECSVMLTLKNTRESVYAKNSEERRNDGSYSNSFEYVLYKGQDGETPVLVKQYFPQVMGVAVVCSGGDNVTVRENIISCLSSVFDIPTSKISVSKLK